jgi:hypothetical protein
MVQFEFKHAMCTNQEPPPIYNPLVVGVGGTVVSTARAGSNAGGVTSPERPQTLVPTPPATSTTPASINPRAAATGMGDSTARWNQPKGGRW